MYKIHAQHRNTQKQPTEVFCKNMCQSLFATGLRRCFPVNVQILRTSNYDEHLRTAAFIHNLCIHKKSKFLNKLHTIQVSNQTFFMEVQISKKIWQVSINNFSSVKYSAKKHPIFEWIEFLVQLKKICL